MNWRRYSTRRTLLAASFIACLCGCAGRLQVGELSRTFDPARLRDRPLGVGGVLLGRGAELDGASLIAAGDQNDDLLVQADTWSVYLYRAFLVQPSGPAVWPWPTVRSQADPVALAEIQRTVARRGIVKPDQVRVLASSLPELGFLALARIDANEVMTEQSIEMVTTTQQAKDGRDVHADPLDRSLSTRRKLQVTLELYDLSSGELAWTGTVTRRRDELYNFTEEAGGLPEVKVSPPSGEDPAPEVTLEGSLVRAPQLEGVLSDACQALVQELTAADE